VKFSVAKANFTSQTPLKQVSPDLQNSFKFANKKDSFNEMGRNPVIGSQITWTVSLNPVSVLSTIVMFIVTLLNTADNK